MDEKNRRGIPLYQDEHDPFAHLDFVASSSDCTGLVPTPPCNEEEAESYAQLHNIPKPQNDPEEFKKFHNADY